MAELISIKHDKDLEVNKKTYNYLNPDFVYIPYEKGYILNIKTNETVNKESVLLSKDNKYIYSPISGTVIGACEMIINKNKVPAIVIENNFCEKVNELSGAKKQINNYSKEEVIKLVNEYNAFEGILEGNIIVINGVDLEIYEATRSYIINQHSIEILETADALYEIFNCNKCYFIIKNNDAENVETLVHHIGTYPNIDLKLMPDLYPIGHKDVLISKLPISKENKKNIIYLTVEEVLAIYNVLRKKRPITEKLVTISGNLIDKSKVINIKIGTTLKDILFNNFKIKSDDYKIIINGLLSGYEVDSLDVVITKDIRSIFINSEKTDKPKRCINCGMCHTKCPMGCSKKHNYNLDKCIECGTCTYICPANINFKDVKGEKND